MSCFRPGGQNWLTFKFLSATTTDADHMVVFTVTISAQFKTTAAFTQFQFLEKAHVGQQPQCAVHGRKGNLHLQLHQLLMHVFSTQMVACAQPFKQFENPLALGSQAAAVLVEAFLQRSVFVDWGRGT